MKRGLVKKITALEEEVTKLTAQLIPMEIDERHSLSRDFPSQASKDGAVTSLRRSLENTQNDLALLKEIRNSKLNLKDEKFFQREIINIGKAQENAMKVLIELKANLARITRVKVILQSRT